MWGIQELQGPDVKKTVKYSRLRGARKKSLPMCCSHPSSCHVVPDAAI
jgi:hypothetical protein